ncbi:MAG: copper homeostasis protein [Acidobacteriaceae bacterium]|nr:copper homeostasis protein [Acidobacteriaceae bacterium]
MKKKILLEISVEALEAAAAAERGGADRIELCRDLSVGGLTPDLASLRAVRQQIQIPIFVMIRQRAGDFVYAPNEFTQMKKSIAVAEDSGADGMVLGILKANRTVDIDRTRELVELAKPLPLTFHRAFDACPDFSQALDDVVRCGASRILTSGGSASALEGVDNIAMLILMADQRVTIVPGAGINMRNILQIAAATGAREFHSGLSSVLPHPQMNYLEFEKEVRAMARRLAVLCE